MHGALLLAAACTAAPTLDHGSSRANILDLFAHSRDTARVAALTGLTRRRVQQVVAAAGLSGRERLLPLHPRFNDIVNFEVTRHGANYGYKMLLGVLKAHHADWRWPREAVQAALRAVDPAASDARRSWCYRRIQRGAYHAPYYMYSTHIDLACKLQEYRIFVAVAIDGRTRFVHSLTALMNKLPVTVYEEFVAPFLAADALPDQIVTDKGREWYVAAFVCLLLARRAGRAGGRAAHRFVPSTRNTPVERFNREVNMRVLVHFRRLINFMEENDLLDKNDAQEVHAFSSVATPLVQAGLDLLKASWNRHSIAGRTGCPGTGGIPAQRAARDPHPGGQLVLPPNFDGAREYEQARGQRLPRVPAFVRSAETLLGRPNARARRAARVHRLLGGDTEEAYTDIVNGDYDAFIDAYEEFLQFV